MKNPKQIWFCLIPAMTLPTIGALAYFVWFSDQAYASYLYTFTKVFTILWPAFCVRIVFKEKIQFPAKLSKIEHLRAVPLGLVSGLVIAALGVAFLHTEIGEVVNTSAPAIRLKAVEMGIVPWYWSFALLLSFVHSLVEEYYWRWFVFGNLQNVVSKPLAHFLAGASFASHHIVIASQFFPSPWSTVLGASVGIGGIVWSILYDRQKTILGSWVSHTCVDLAIFVIAAPLILPNG